jgi:transposase
VVSCYEAGRDGFWIHRALVARGVQNRIVDSSSIEVDRRRRRAKTDRLDAFKLVRMLVRVCVGECGVWREVRVPTVAEEAARHVSRERTALVAEQTRLINQMRGWLTTWGCELPAKCVGAWWTRLTDRAGASLVEPLQARLARATARLQLVREQIAALEAAQQRAVRTASAESPAGRLRRVKGLGATSISVLLEEGLVWRTCRNRRGVGGILSGDSEREQGIRGAGNTRLQATTIQLAWGWLRWQPASAITQWYYARFGTGKRARRIGIVAVARKLLIALWRYATTGIIPAGAIVRPSST